MVEKPPKNLGGRPKKGEWVEERLFGICARVALGETLTAVCKDPGMPSPSAFRAAVYRSKELQDAWEKAKDERPHALFEEAIDLARELRDHHWERDDTNIVRAKQIAIEALRTAAARLSPREYGERPAASVVVPVQINTTLGLDPSVAPTTRQSVYSIEAQIPDGSQP